MAPEQNPSPETAEALLRRLGLTGKFTGFQSAIYLVEKVVEDPTNLKLVTKRLYPETAAQLGITPSALERSVRTLVQVCWNRGDRKYLDLVAGFHLTERPSNTEFIDILANYLRKAV